MTVLTCNIGHNFSLQTSLRLQLYLSKGVYRAEITCYISTVDLNILSWYNFAL